MSYKSQSGEGEDLARGIDEWVGFQEQQGMQKNVEKGKGERKTHDVIAEGSQ